MLLKRNFFLVGVLIVLLLTLIFLYLLVSQKTLKKSLPVVTFLTAYGESKPLSISLVAKNNFEVHQIIGVLEKVYDEGGTPFIDVAVPNKQEVVILKIDLVGKDYVLTQKTVKRGPLSNTVASPSASNKTGVIEKANPIAVTDLLTTLNKNVGRPIIVEVVASAQPSRINCSSSVCQTRLDAFRKYEQNNNKLFNLSLVRDSVVPIGAPTLFQFENIDENQ